jgi:hypothetical protein
MTSVQSESKEKGKASPKQPMPDTKPRRKHWCTLLFEPEHTIDSAERHRLAIHAKLDQRGRVREKEFDVLSTYR